MNERLDDERAALAARPDRGVVSIGGPDAATFLHGVVTGTVKTIPLGEGRFSALLTPQGKLLFDFFLIRTEEGFLVEIERARIPDFVKRLGFYRLRAQVTITDVSHDFDVFVAWGGEAPKISGAIAFADPRLPALGTHLVVPMTAGAAAGTDVVEWQAHRIALGVPESGVDFEFGDFFPHDTDMDDLDGVDFKKGCFVGQEVVSRMKHRGTARRRFVVAEGAGPLPAVGTEIVAGEKAIGTLGSSAGATGLALVRIDRAREAMDAGAAITAGGVALTLKLPSFAKFVWPEPEKTA